MKLKIICDEEILSGNDRLDNPNKAIFLIKL